MIAPSFVALAVRMALIFGVMVGVARADDRLFSTDFSALEIGSSPYPAYVPGTLATATVLVQPDPVTGFRSLQFTSQTAVDFSFGLPARDADLATATAWYNYIN